MKASLTATCYKKLLNDLNEIRLVTLTSSLGLSLVGSFLAGFETAGAAKKSSSSSCSSSSNRLIVVFVFGLDFGSSLGCGFVAEAPNNPPPSSSSSSLNSPPPDFDLVIWEAGEVFTSIFLGATADALNNPVSSFCGVIIAKELVKKNKNLIQKLSTIQSVRTDYIILDKKVILKFHSQLSNRRENF